MNRVIKFRAWDKKLKKFLYFNLFDYNTATYTDKDNYIVHQFTGIKDSNGVDIYEGDILIYMGKWDENGKVLPPDYLPYEVKWSAAGFSSFLMSRKKNMSMYRHNELVGVGHTDSKVIGNVSQGIF